MRRVIQIFIASIILVSLASIISSDTPTEVTVPTPPPTLLQDIPDFLVITSTPLIDAFDLDDYFEDLSGEGMTFGHTPLSNVTVTIDSDNKVSFYPDAGYEGIQQMTFNATNSAGTADSNQVQITVGEDTIPPQWTSPRKNRVSVYQNYHVTFTTEWTDNTELRDFIFSINQGLGWQNKTLTTFTGSANTSTFVIQISASPNTNVSWTFYATDIHDNANKVDVQSFTVKEFTVIPGEEYDSDTEYDSGEEGEAAERIYGTGVTPEYFAEGLLAESLEVDTRSIKVSLKQGATLTRVVKVINTGSTSIEIIASVKTLGHLITLGDTLFEIAPGETKELLVEFTIPMNTMPDQYFGFLVLDYGDQMTIPIVIDVKKFESEVKINVNLTEESEIVKVGEDVVAFLTIKNQKDITENPSQLYYALKNFKGDIITSKNEDITLSVLFEEERSLTVPEGVPDGEYIFYARIVSEDSIDLDSDTFLLGARFKIIATLKKFFYPFMILLLLLILLLLYIIYRRNKRRKELLELYLLLNQLRALVKEGKTIEAMSVYKKIKLTYGQHVSKGFAEDEPKLREELSKFSKLLTKTEKKLEEKIEKKPAEAIKPTVPAKTPLSKTPASKPEVTPVKTPEAKPETPPKDKPAPVKTPEAKPETPPKDKPAPEKTPEDKPVEPPKDKPAPDSKTQEPKPTTPPKPKPEEPSK